MFKNKQTKSRGGVALYLHDTIKHEIRNDLSLFVQGEFESVFVEINRDGYKTIAGENYRDTIAGEIYTDTNSNAILSLQWYENILQKLTSYKHTVIMGTDQNFTLLKIDTHKMTNDLLKMFYSSGFMPAITKPNWTTYRSAPLIDNIYSSEKDVSKIKSGIIEMDISDNFPVFSFIGQAKRKYRKHDSLSDRPFNSIPAISDLKGELQSN